MYRQVEPQVDIHCHLFNAADLPVRGFVRSTKLHNVPLADRLARLVDRLVQGSAPGFEAELALLDTLLEAPTGLELAPTAFAQPPEEFEHEVDRALAAVQAEDPELLTRIGAELAAEEQTAPDTGVERLADVADLARRVVRWVKLFGRSRVDLCAELVRTFNDEIDLAVPLVVDLGTNLDDHAETTVEQQMVLFEKLSRASMRGVLPGGGRAHVHPFIGFDPLRELRARRTHAIETPFESVQKAITRYGFVGVKLYPPMGWRPSGNAPRPGLTADDAAAIDRIVDELAAWCAAEDVPVTAHCNRSNHAHPAYEGFGGPDDWVPVLDAHEGLRLNLGHFGGEQTGVSDDRWSWKIAAATRRFEHLYADVGNHRVHDERVTEPYLDMLAHMFDDPATATMASRVMYGSDWYMLAIYPDNDRFLPTYRGLFEHRFGTDIAAGFMGGTAMRFLGFDDPSNRNTRRLRERYARFAPERTPTWLATESAGG